MVGHWEGSARIIVSWCQQQNLQVAVDIAADGSVAGKVGDATLTKGRLKRNRGRLGRKLNLKTYYIIEAASMVLLLLSRESSAQACSFLCSVPRGADPSQAAFHARKAKS